MHATLAVVRRQPMVNEQTLEMTLRARPECLPDVRECIGRFALDIGFDDEAAGNIVLSVDEALTNVIKHGYGGPCDQSIEIRIEQRSLDNRVGLGIVVRDFGRQVDPAEIRSRDLEDIKPGGLGVHIMRTTMDRVEFSLAEGRGMRLEMEKYLPNSH